MSSSTTAPKLPTVITETLPVVVDAIDVAAPSTSLPNDSNAQPVAATSVIATTEVGTSVVATQSRFTTCPVCSQYIFIPTANSHVMKCLAATN